LSPLKNLQPLSAILILLNAAIQTQKGEGSRPIVSDTANVPHDGAVFGARMLLWALRMVNPALHLLKDGEEKVEPHE